MYKIAVLLIAFHICCAMAYPPCVCTREMRPVCGSNGETYHNNCLFECAATSIPSLRVIHRGMCEHFEE
ncbi:bdellin B-3-like [Leguminivora glycinivorella]|uniref:bdellin B-3-like n=1 Tax=Leguminivora glycinivorella TaxID=1035111 RepID=UPI0020104D29|nr:bdellin B-3-like [Leguminivora glycinivorella]